MTWFGWLLIVMWTLSALASVAAVGKPRKPVTASLANYSVLTAAVLILGALAIGTGHL